MNDALCFIKKTLLDFYTTRSVSFFIIGISLSLNHSPREWFLFIRTR